MSGGGSGSKRGAGSGVPKPTYEEKRAAREARNAERAEKRAQKKERDKIPTQAQTRAQKKALRDANKVVGVNIHGKRVEYWHGTHRAYETFKCRCQPCRAVKATPKSRETKQNLIRKVETLTQTTKKTTQKATQKAAPK